MTDPVVVETLSITIKMLHSANQHTILAPSVAMKPIMLYVVMPSVVSSFCVILTYLRQVPYSNEAK
jgi:hypothetical protein